ncbi:hypothetical protein DY000_02038744 [Brassica cretica]|uniref:Phorbol-ester/DAG-type domain-containing protein n=1 Tax=Brassica cretica TaxID=69181 RepID=A0ABQ7BBG7_BRACR|nr:hypothetical protein DY000_02038744 [Brassica cretica]
MDLSSAPVAQTGRCHSTLDSLCKFYSNHTKFDHVQYSLGGSRMVRKTPPPGYICHRCNVSVHSNCFPFWDYLWVRLVPCRITPRVLPPTVVGGTDAAAPLLSGGVSHHERPHSNCGEPGGEDRRFITFENPFHKTERPAGRSVTYSREIPQIFPLPSTRESRIWSCMGYWRTSSVCRMSLMLLFLAGYLERVMVLQICLQRTPYLCMNKKWLVKN